MSVYQEKAYKKKEGRTIFLFFILEVIVLLFKLVYGHINKKRRVSAVFLLHDENNFFVLFLKVRGGEEI